MWIFSRIFKFNNEKEIKNYIENDVDNKVKCSNCNALVDKSTKYCWKCGTQEYLVNREPNETTNDLIEEKQKYQYADLELIENKDFKLAIKNIPDSGVINVPLGIDSDGEWLYCDITKMPNLLIGGTVMCGKTNMINSILLSLICKYSSDIIRIIIADSKGVDYLNYSDEPHLLTPVINDAKKLIIVLNSEIDEMRKRYLILKEKKMKNLLDYNKLNEENKIPYHLIFIDDYISFVNSNVEEFNFCVEELTKNGWNVGIHLVIVANHPTAAVLPSMSKLNFPTRISFRVPSIKDSRMILEVPGAEKISGIGNALINSNLIGEVKQIHTNIIEDSDICAVVKDLSSKNKTQYNYEKDLIDSEYEYCEPLYNEVKDFVIQNGKVSVSLLQRKFRLGYNRAARIVDLLEEGGIVGPQNGTGLREVLAKNEK